MSIADTMAGIALRVSAAVGAGYWDGLAKWPGEPVMEYGSIVSPGTPVEKACSVQVDSVTDAMRTETGYTEKDMRLLVLSATLDGALDTDATVEVLGGPHTGEWMISTCTRDPAGLYWECRGRRAV